MRALHDTRARRKVLLSIYSLLLIAALAAILLISSLVLMSKMSLSDRLAEVADIIAGGTAVLAVLAGLVALQAYAAATGLPNLEVQVWFSRSAKNMPVFLAREASAGVLETVNPSDQTTAMISLRNRSVYSARDPIVIVRISSVISNDSRGYQLGDEWSLFEFPDDPLGNREMVVQWDGGLGAIIHGHSSRRLPDLRFGSLSYDRLWQPPKMRVEIIADGGYRRHVDLPLFFLSDSGSEVDLGSRRTTAQEWL